ncbi:MAG: hypothetical protein DYG98_27510 [Haliscomenobacteraceae bacterium CHB4]|nr:hypothetical protein [Haliscomenobacteraceae bacterium CHB4]
MDLFFNELSLRKAADRYVVNSWFEAMGTLYKQASARGLGEIKVPAAFFGHAFTEAYTFYQWVSDQSFDSDLRSLLKSKITTTPVIEEMLREQETESRRIFECRFAGDTANGLGAASEPIFDAMAISIAPDGVWDTSNVTVEISIFQEDDIMQSACDVRHIYRVAHLDAHAPWLEVQRRPRIPNGQVLWLRRNELFPHLIFCEHIRGQISGFSPNQPEFIQLQKRLFELEEYAAKRKAGVFQADEIPTKVTPESETRKRDFANELIRLCPDGVTRLFDWHARFTPGAWRLHFYPLENTNKIIVGNIANQNEIK